MNIYTIYTNPCDDNPLENSFIIKEGFSLSAAIFSVLTAFYYKMWGVGAYILLVEVFFSVLQNYGYISSEVLDALNFGIMLFIGTNFNDWRQEQLTEKGYILQDIIQGKNQQEAYYNFLSLNAAPHHLCS